MSTTLTTARRSKTLPSSLDTLPVIYASSSAKHTSRIGSTRRPHVAIPSKTRRSGVRRATVAVDNTLGLAVADDEFADFASSRRVLSPLTSPRHDVREDPFSLGSFFPSRPGSPSVESLAWLSPVEETVQEVDEGLADEVSGVQVSRKKAELFGGSHSRVVPSRSFSMAALDDYAREVIAKEDRLGILSLIRIPSFFKGITSSAEDENDEDELDVPITPTSMALDEPYDDETLYESLCSRRAAASAQFGSVPVPETELAAAGLGVFSLFSPTTEARESELAWANALYSKMLGDH